MKKLFAFVIAAAFVICTFFAVNIKTDRDAQGELFVSQGEEYTETTEAVSEKPLLRAVWISYFELTVMNDSDKSENAFRKKAHGMMEKTASKGLDTVFLHVRPSSDAFYKSDIYPYTMYLTGTEGKDPGYDPLGIFCEYAKEYGIDIHAWLNPFRVCSASNLSSRAKNNPAVEILNDADSENDDMVVTVGSGIYYNPSLGEVHALIADGVKELFENYPIKGIHIDDYFYPTTSVSIDETAYGEYTENGGMLSLSDWRRSSMDSFVSLMYNTVKSYGDDKIFSISPEADIEENYNENYADVIRWASQQGYCDYLIPQLYYGFEHEKYPFIETADRWNALSENIPIVFGLASYKVGETDRYAGTGADEWMKNDDIIERQIEYVKGLSSYKGYALFSYSYIK